MPNSQCSQKNSLWLDEFSTLFLVQLLVKYHLLEGRVQGSLRNRFPIPAPVVCRGALLHELDARGEEMLANQFALS